MGGDGVLDVALPEVPHLAAVVLAAGDDVGAVRRPVRPRHPLEVALQEHDALPRA